MSVSCKGSSVLQGNLLRQDIVIETKSVDGLKTQLVLVGETFFYENLTLSRRDR